MTHRATPVACGFALLAFACAGQPISTSYDYNPNADFATLRTYAWMPIRSDQLTTFELERVTNAVETGLQEKGFQRAANADFLLKVFAGKGLTLSSGYGWSGMEHRRYEEGTLVIDMVDPISNRLLWRGTATKTLDANPTPEQQAANIARAVRAVLEQFPPQTR